MTEDRKKHDLARTLKRDFDARIKRPQEEPGDAGEKLREFIRDEPEWTQPALLRFFERFRDGECSAAITSDYHTEREKAEAAYLTKLA